MGYTTTNTSMFSPAMQQTPDNVRKVLDIAGWTAEEAAEAIDVATSNIEAAAVGEYPLLDGEWRRLLDVCGKRAFDEGCDE